MFSFSSPTAEQWLEIIESRRRELLNPSQQMFALLLAVRQDVDQQFDTKQQTWTPLKPYTVQNKADIGADPRILHKTKVGGKGLRLRDAYKQTGRITTEGLLEYSYPEEKPYAKEHQEGLVPENTSGRKQSRHLTKRIKTMDEEYDEIFRRG